MTRADFVILWDNFSNEGMVIEEKQKNGAQLFFTSNIENYIIKGELMDERSKGFEPAGPFSVC